MGSAASSALRVDETAYGSLEGLGSGLGGGVRKLKKKPVLVLDPEELAQAHAAFHEASAEQLGETVERTPKPAMILGLAPMDEDDAEEMGQSENVDEDADTGQQSVEDVLSLTRRKSAPVVDDTDPLGLDNADVDPVGSDAMQDDGDIGMGPIERLSTIEDGLDIANRIFPSLSLDGGANQEFGDADPISPVTPTEQSPLMPVPTQNEEIEASEPGAAPEEAPEETALDAVARRVEGTSKPADVEPLAPEATAAEPDIVQPDKTALEDAAQSETPSPAPVRFDELNPSKDYETPDEVYDLDAWLSDDEVEVDLSDDEPTERLEEIANASQAEHAAEPETEAQEVTSIEAVDSIVADNAPGEGITYTDDDSVDGYAFMRDQSPRRKVLNSAQPGQQSALRAKLLREAEVEQEAEDGDPPSLLARWWNRLLAFLRGGR